MNKNRNIIIFIVIFAFILNIISNYKVRKELDSFRREISNLSNNMNTQMQNLENHFDRRYNGIGEILEKEQSFFEDTSFNMNLKGNKIFVTMKAIPKEITVDERLIAKIVTENNTYEKELDENNTATFEIDIEQVLEPIFMIKSDTTLKQEKLIERYTTDMLSKNIHSEWSNDEKHILEVWINGNEDSLFLTKDEIDKAEFIVTWTESDLGANSSGSSHSSRAMPDTVAAWPIDEGEMIGEFFENLDGISLQAKEIENNEGLSKYELGYCYDFSEYADRKDGNIYEIYFSLTTKGGIKFVTPYNNIATFRTMKDGSSTSSGSDRLVPIFD